MATEKFLELLDGCTSKHRHSETPLAHQVKIIIINRIDKAPLILRPSFSAAVCARIYICAPLRRRRPCSFVFAFADACMRYTLNISLAMAGNILNRLCSRRIRYSRRTAKVMPIDGSAISIYSTIRVIYADSKCFSLVTYFRRITK